MKQIPRYARQELVVGAHSQKKISRANVAIVGLGALGSVASELLCRAGVGTLTLIDRDIVELSNLQRQTLYAEEDIGKPKAVAAYHRLKKINSAIKITPIITDINHKNSMQLLKKANIIVDCTDNLYTRFLINDFAKKNKKPWVYAGCISEQGSVSLLVPNGPCFRCFTQESIGLDTCDTAGVLNTVSVMTASIQVQLAMQWLRENKESKDVLIHLNLKTMSFTTLKIKKNNQCPACSGKFEFLSGSKEPKTIQYQCSGLYQFNMGNVDLESMEKKAKNIGTVKKGRGFLMFEGLTLFDNGRILIKARSLEKAKALISKYIGI